MVAGVISWGTSLAGGEGRCNCTLIGVLILRVINNGIISGWNEDLQIVVAELRPDCGGLLRQQAQAARANVITT